MVWEARCLAVPQDRVPDRSGAQGGLPEICSEFPRVLPKSTEECNHEWKLLRPIRRNNFQSSRRAKNSSYSHGQNNNFTIPHNACQIE